MLEGFSEHTDNIKDFGREKGYPEDALELLCAVTFWEWDRKIFMKTYATIVDWSSPEYQKAIKEHNQDLRILRQHLSSTEIGKQTLAAIPRKERGRSTIVYPALPEEFATYDAFTGKPSQKSWASNIKKGK